MKINWLLFVITYLVIYNLTLALNWLFSGAISSGSSSDFLRSGYQFISYLLLYPPIGTGMRLAILAATPLVWKLAKDIDFFKGSKVREEKQIAGMLGYIFTLGLLVMFPIILLIIGPPDPDSLDYTGYSSRRGATARLLLSRDWASCLFYLVIYIFSVCFIREMGSLFRKLRL